MSNAFSGMADMMNMGDLSSIVEGAGFGQPVFSRIDCAEIKIYKQQRSADEMENDEQKLEELAESIKKRGLLEPIVVCENEDGPEPWRLVCGERRLRSAMLAGLEQIPAMCHAKLTEEEINEIQYAENVHRLNLSQLNEASVLKKDLDELDGDIEKLMAKHNKSRSWISKRLSLLELPPETVRLVKEGITADVEVINAVKQIEKRDPELARETVQELKENAGKKGTNARDIAKKGKDKVKPPKPQAPKKAPANPDNVATPRDESHKENGPVTDVPPATLANDPALQELQQTFAAGAQDEQDDAGNELADALGAAGLDEQQEQEQEPQRERNAPALPPVEVLDQAFSLVCHSGADPKMVLSQMAKDDRDGAEDWLHSFYEAGTSAPNLALAVIQGFRNGQFAQEGHGALALVAFLSGGEDGVLFNMLNILGTVKG